MNTLKVPKCEVCSSDAIVAIQDVEQVPPNEEETWILWKPAGTHYFCAKHKRESSHKYHDSTPKISIDSAKIMAYEAECLGRALAHKLTS